MANLPPNECVIPGRLSYLSILEPKVINNVGEPKYSLKILIPKTDKATLATLAAARDAARQNGVTERRKGNKPPPFADFSAARLAEISINLQDGDAPKHLDKNPENAGHWLLNASSPANQPVGVLNINKEKVKKDSETATDIYSGMYGMVHLSLFPYETAGNVGIGVGLVNVMKTKDGDPLGGSVRAKAEDVFGAPDGDPFSNAVGAGSGVAAGSGSPI